MARRKLTAQDEAYICSRCGTIRVMPRPSTEKGIQCGACKTQLVRLPRGPLRCPVCRGRQATLPCVQCAMNQGRSIPELVA